MKVKERVARYLFSDIQHVEMSATPLVDAIESELYGTDLLPIVTRDEALSVPGVMRARNTIASIATLPLRTYAANWTEVDTELFQQIDPTTTNVVTLANTLEDLLLHKYSYWKVLERDVDDLFPVSIEYVDIRLVSDPTTPLFKGSERDKADNVLRINGKVVPWSDVIRFESPNPGFLKHGARVVKRALDLDQTSAKYANNPRPLDYFTPDQDADPLDDNGIRSFLRKWRDWLRKRTTGYVPAGMKYVSVDQPTPAELQLIEAQKQVGLSIANMTGLDPEDLGISTTSRTYQNATDRRQDRINEVFAAYMRAITDRLSMGDVTRKGHVVQFDLTDYMKADDKTRAEVQISRKDAGLLTADEIRAIEHRPALTNQPEEVTNGTSAERP